jgi:Leucine-rich repeat (LRR) protein
MECFHLAYREHRYVLYFLKGALPHAIAEIEPWARTMGELTEDLMIEFSGEKNVASIHQLVLRGLGLSSVGPLLSAVNLVSVSFSHNALRSLSLPDGALPKLKELNINSNMIADLAFLAGVPALERLYASSNQIADLSPMSHNRALTTACLHGNRVASLQRAILALSCIPSLQESPITT